MKKLTYAQRQAPEVIKQYNPFSMWEIKRQHYVKVAAGVYSLKRPVSISTEYSVRGFIQIDF